MGQWLSDVAWRRSGANPLCCSSTILPLRLNLVRSRLHQNRYLSLGRCGCFSSSGCRTHRKRIAQRRFVKVTEREVEFLTKDKKLKRAVPTRYSIELFIALWADQVPDRYRHAIRYFGLLAPGTKSRLWTALFFLLGQERRPRPKRLSWRNSLRQCFGVDPLVDRTGEPMKWVRRQKPAVPRLVA